MGSAQVETWEPGGMPGNKLPAREVYSTYRPSADTDGENDGASGSAPFAAKLIRSGKPNVKPFGGLGCAPSCALIHSKAAKHGATVRLPRNVVWHFVNKPFLGEFL